MALTPQDVQQKLFTTVRLREGYETSEVDEFCEEVETELTRLLKEVDGLREQLATAERTAAGSGVRSDVSAAAGDVELSPEDGAGSAPRTAAPREIVVRTTAEVSAAAARVLEMAQRTADEYLGEARAEADQLVTDARGTAQQLTADARAKADEIDRETHERTTALERQIAEQRQEALEQLQEEKRRLESEAETLRSFEREYRGRLRTFLESQLDQLSVHENEGTPLAPQEGPPGRADAGAGGATTGGGPDGAEESPGAGLAADSTATAPGAAADGDDSGRASLGRADNDGTTGTPRSAFGRILEEEEREAQGH